MHFVFIQQTDKIHIIVIKGFLWAQIIFGQHQLLLEIVDNTYCMFFIDLWGREEYKNLNLRH